MRSLFLSVIYILIYRTAAPRPSSSSLSLASPSTRTHTLSRLSEPLLSHAVSASGSDLETTSSTLFLQHSTLLSLSCAGALVRVCRLTSNLSLLFFGPKFHFPPCFRLLELLFCLSFYCFAFVFSRGVGTQEHTFPIDTLMTETAQSPDVTMMSLKLLSYGGKRFLLLLTTTIFLLADFLWACMVWTCVQVFHKRSSSSQALPKKGVSPVPEN